MPKVGSKTLVYNIIRTHPSSKVLLSEIFHMLQSSLRILAGIFGTRFSYISVN